MEEWHRISSFYRTERDGVTKVEVGRGVRSRRHQGVYEDTEEFVSVEENPGNMTSKGKRSY